jgi:predicted DNA-binding helix-hairpin-helix protein
MEERMQKEKSLNKYYKQLEQLRKKLASIDLILPGSIHKRTIEKDDLEKKGKTRTIGPYYQWTWKKKGKTVNINLSEQQAMEYQKAIDEHREVDRIIKEMRTISLEILENTLPTVKRKKIKKIEF